MRKLFRSTMGLITAGIAFVYLISCFSFIISPAFFSPIALLGLAFPYLFVGMVTLIVLNLFRDKRLALILSVVLLPGLYNFFHVVAFHPRKWQMEKSPGTLRVLTWNVEGYSMQGMPPEKVPAGILHTIQQYNPDILFLQESSHHVWTLDGWRTTEQLMDSIGYKGHFQASDSTFWERHMVAFNTGVALFSKMPIVNDTALKILEVPHEQQHCIGGTTTFNGVPIRIMTARLSSLNLYWDTAHVGKNIYQITFDRKRMVQHQIRSVERLHKEQIKMIRAAIDRSKEPVIYCGDMNSVPTSYNYSLMRADNFQDAFLKGGWGIGASFHNIAPTLRIDAIFCDKDRFKVLQSKVVKVDLSDHYPVVADLQLR
ncbi:MAG: endonuclease/exonuclease/phosphatase family protein [Chitinophagaceae bacterium]